jgi:hypothetical protein
MTFSIPTDHIHHRTHDFRYVTHFRKAGNNVGNLEKKGPFPPSKSRLNLPNCIFLSLFTDHIHNRKHDFRYVTHFRKSAYEV